MSLIDLARQVSGKLGYKRGGTGNKNGWATAVVEPLTGWSTVATLPLGTLVRLRNGSMVEPTDTTDETTALGIVVGHYDGPQYDQLVEEDCPIAGVAAVMTKGKCYALIGANVDADDFAFAHATDGTAYGSATLAAGAIGMWLTNGLTATQDTALLELFGATVMGAGGGSPLTTKGDLYGFSTVDARVPVGSNGKVLTANSADTEGVDWQTPTLPTLIAAKGDLVVGTANDTPAVLTVGTDGKMLSARASATEGVAWEDEKGELMIGFTSPVNNSLSRPIRVPANCTLIGWYLVGNAAGSVVLDIWKDVFANYPPTVADTIISGGTKPTLSAARTNSDTTLTGYSTSWTEGDWILVNVDSVSGLTEVVIALAVKRR